MNPLLENAPQHKASPTGTTNDLPDGSAVGASPTVYVSQPAPTHVIFCEAGVVRTRNAGWITSEARSVWPPPDRSQVKTVTHEPVGDKAVDRRSVAVAVRSVGRRKPDLAAQLKPERKPLEVNRGK